MIFSDILRPDSDPHVIPDGNIRPLLDPDSVPAMRTITRPVAMSELSADTRKELDGLFRDFGREKTLFIERLRSRELRPLTVRPAGYRVLRDRLVAEKYASSSGLQARHWKLALQCAHILSGNYWKLVRKKAMDEIRSRSWPDRIGDDGRRYLEKVLRDFAAFFNALDRRYPKFEGIDLDFRQRRGICRGIIRAVHKVQGAHPHPDEQNSVWFDCSCYSIEEKAGGQYISLMTKTRGRRIRLRLLGHVKLSGKPTVMLVRKGDALAVHEVVPLRVVGKPAGVPKTPQGSSWCVGLDAGVTEVYTTDDDFRVGDGLGREIRAMAEEIDERLKHRNFLEALAKTTKDPRKRRNILKFNLGGRTWDSRRRRLRTRVTQVVNTALNTLLEKRPADVYVVEELSERFRFDGKFSRRVRRMLSGWVRGTMRERLAFKAARHGIRVAYVAAAYSSQACPRCGYADRKNRSGDSFRCLNCGLEAPSDQVGARSLLLRAGRGGWRRRMRRSEAWRMQRANCLDCCARLGIRPKDDPHEADASGKRSSD